MFDIGFWELTIIAVVTLLVVGPERMPALARTAGKWFGKISRFISSVKSDIDRELKAEEMKKVMEKHASTAGLHDIIEETQADMKEIHEATEEMVSATNEVAQEAEDSSAPVDQTDPKEKAEKKYNSDDEYY
ncbi:MAG: twin-arginine translocase subunit TatB [Gammaproteobacteria bacterium]|uniref:Sec-independent protein translocase protein TatB n=1 Tax=Candidatus Thiopontia autotrophica TaxID=2841688 RepID=A0A8J6PE03_9GAMM|nr:twin-arginine translocase subunit TatB [Candidatus Thiopontia autotrophica]